MGKQEIEFLALFVQHRDYAELEYWHCSILNMSQEYLISIQLAIARGKTVFKAVTHVKDSASQQGIFFQSLYFQQCLCIRGL